MNLGSNQHVAEGCVLAKLRLGIRAQRQHLGAGLPGPGDERIQQLAANPEDDLESKRLKKRKLQLKDCIARLESLLIPDEPA